MYNAPQINSKNAKSISNQSDSLRSTVKFTKQAFLNDSEADNADKDAAAKLSASARSVNPERGFQLDETFSITQMDLHTRKNNHLGKKGLKVQRMFTKNNEQDIYAGIKFDKRVSKIVNTDGSSVFEMKDVEVPEYWSQVATDILAQKYLRKKGVPQFNLDGTPILDETGKQLLGAEKSIKQAAHRLAGTWRYWGEKYGYFDSAEDAQAFEDEVKYMIVDQIAVPNSPQWFNTGLHWAYGITGEAQGHYYIDPDTGKLSKSTDAYSRPQPHACFIQTVKDDLVNEGGIFDLLTKEARLFKYGSGTGTNFSAVRGEGEPLAGGGSSSGLMSFLKVLDSGAGAIQSGGTTRRAAKMVILDADHPEVEKFIDWKVIEEQKVAALVAGSQITYRHLKAVMQSAEDHGIDTNKNAQLQELIKAAKSDFVSLNYVKRVLMLVENGVKTVDFDFATFDTDFRSEAYTTVGGQNSNNSVRVTNAYLEAVQTDANWDLINRVNGQVNKTIRARDLWDKINYAAWSCADPGLQFHTTVNEWNTAAADGQIVGSNPCSEYMFLDETACNLYQINMLKFYNVAKAKFDTKAFEHVVRLSTIILEVSVLMSQLPSKTMAVGTYNYRTLGLGYANIGAVLMYMGLPYDSDKGFAMTAGMTAIMGGEAYATSAEISAVLGAFPRYEANASHMLKVIRNHRRAAYSADNAEYEGLTVFPDRFKFELIDADVVKSARQSWDYALALGMDHGYRNGHVTCIAPTGTSGLVMDCDTTGIEPDFALVKFKKLVGGGYFKIVNQAIEPALRNLGYPEDQIRAIVDYAVGTQSLAEAPHINRASLQAKGFTDNELAAIETVLPSVFELKYAISKWTVGEDFCQKVLRITPTELNSQSFDLLESLGFSDSQIADANEYICGSMTVEGAPFLKKEHYAVFDTANKNGSKGTRYISYRGHLKQMAAAQPFISGAISKTINMPEEATISDVEKAYLESWQLMLKATALYRDSSKLSQPLSTGSGGDDVYAKLFSFSEDEVSSGQELETEQVHKVIYKEAMTEAASDVARPLRKRLPDERRSITHRFSVAGHEGYLTVGLYEDGAPGELFITMSKEGSTLSGIANALALSISLNLQYGVPIETLVKKFSHVRFEPSGFTENPEIPMVKSLIDYIARWFGIKFLDKDKAKQYHNSELVDRAYGDQGSMSRVQFNTTVAAQSETVIVFNQNATNMPASSKSNSSANGAAQPQVLEREPKTGTGYATHIDLAEFSKLQQQLANKSNNEDAPLCSTCGSVTIRNGACYKCPDCGTTTGCS